MSDEDVTNQDVTRRRKTISEEMRLEEANEVMKQEREMEFREFHTKEHKETLPPGYRRTSLALWIAMPTMVLAICALGFAVVVGLRVQKMTPAKIQTLAREMTRLNRELTTERQQQLINSQRLVDAYNLVAKASNIVEEQKEVIDGLKKAAGEAGQAVALFGRRTDEAIALEKRVALLETVFITKPVQPPPKPPPSRPPHRKVELVECETEILTCAADPRLKMYPHEGARRACVAQYVRGKDCR